MARGVSPFRIWASSPDGFAEIAGTGDFSGNGQSGMLWPNTNGDTGLWNPNGSGGFTFEDLGVVGPSWSVHKIFA